MDLAGGLTARHSSVDAEHPLSGDTRASRESPARKKFDAARRRDAGVATGRRARQTSEPQAAEQTDIKLFDLAAGALGEAHALAAHVRSLKARVPALDSESSKRRASSESSTDVPESPMLMCA